ncbi:MAG: HAMP domain-containing protein [Clostridiales bacterium]|nr:HAMP domain-containing protein [Clostridiales bacterium]
MRWKVLLAFFLIIGLSFLIMAGMLTNMLGRYLFEQRIRADRAGLEKWAVQAAPFLYAADTQTLTQTLAQAGDELSGRVLLLDGDGKVQLDSFREAHGRRLEYPEVVSILLSGQTADYGVHSLKTGRQARSESMLGFGAGDEWVSYCTAGIIHSSRVVGVLLLVSSVGEMMQNLYALQDSLVLIFVVVAIVAILAGMIFSGVLTRPIVALTGVIRQMSKGDFAARVPEKGSGELKHLASAFNSMSEKLQTLDQSRNEFVSNASHELKTPLATMKILIESLIYQPEMETQLRTEFLTDINAEINRLSAIVSDLLTLVQADAHTMRLDREKLSLAAIAKETAHRLEPIAAQRGQTISLSLEDSGDMYADKSKLRQVVYNLLDNAVKYTQDGGKISLGVARGGRDIILTVADNGPGIRAESLPHVFDRFYRVDKARSRESGGTGLGLSIVRQIVTLHGGSIRAESEEGKGATFIVELPLHRG